MDSKLTDRLRGIVNTHEPTVQADLRVCSTDGPTGSLLYSNVEEVLGGQWRHNGGAPCFVVERRAPADSMYGRVPVGELAVRLDCAAKDAPLLAAGRPAPPPFVFFDLETTGISGGAGTYAFLVGCGWFADDRAFVTRQYVLVKFADERPLLQAVAGELARAGALVSFNGKSFDAPVLQTRYLFHRLDWALAHLPHLDVLHPARQFWGPSVDSTTTCSLIALERHVLGRRRVGDVPGFEIPARYFQFVRSGDARLLVAVLEHNRLDLLSLAGLTARLLQLVGAGPDEAHDAREVLALGRVYARGGLGTRARDAFERAAGMAGSMASGNAAMALSSASMALIRIDALRALALAERRARRYEEAAAYWRQVIDSPGCPRHVAREATQALAIHHEHRVRDLTAAKAFALRSLEIGVHPAWSEAVRHRLARIERKMGAAANPQAATFELGH